MKKFIISITGILMCLLTAACRDDEMKYKLEDKDSFIFYADGCKAVDDAYILQGDKYYDGQILLTNEQKDWMDDGKDIVCTDNGKECFRLRKSEVTEDTYEFIQGDITQYASLGEHEKYSYLSDEDFDWVAIWEHGLPIDVKLETEIEVTIPHDAQINVINYYAYVISEYPENEDEYIWDMDKFYELYAKEYLVENFGGRIRVITEDGNIRLEELYNP